MTAAPGAAPSCEHRTRWLDALLDAGRQADVSGAGLTCIAAEIFAARIRGIDSGRSALEIARLSAQKSRHHYSKSTVGPPIRVTPAPNEAYDHDHTADRQEEHTPYDAKRFVEAFP